MKYYGKYFKIAVAIKQYSGYHYGSVLKTIIQSLKGVQASYTKPLNKGIILLSYNF